MSDDLPIPTGLPSLLDWIERYSADIYVRVNLDDGKGWQTLALTEMPPAVAIATVCGFIRDGRVPVRVRREMGIG